jgi:hypothetical protein
MDGINGDLQSHRSLNMDAACSIERKRVGNKWGLEKGTFLIISADWAI